MEYHKQYHLDDEDKILAKIKEYWKNSKDKLNEYHKQYYLNNKEYRNQYYLNNNKDIS